MYNFFGDKKGQKAGGTFLGNLHFFGDKKGQEGYVFRLLVGAVIGVVIIGIILVLISKTEEQKNYLSNESLITNLKYAVKAPTSEDYVINNVIIKKDTYFSYKYLEEQTNLPQNCIALKSNKMVIKAIGGGLHAEQNIETKVTVNCKAQQGGCEIFCDIVFG